MYPKFGKLLSRETTSVEYANKQEVVQQLFRQEGRDGEGKGGKRKDGSVIACEFHTLYRIR